MNAYPSKLVERAVLALPPGRVGSEVLARLGYPQAVMR